MRDEIKTSIMTVYLVVTFSFSSVNFLIELTGMFSGTWRGLEVVFLKILYLKISLKILRDIMSDFQVFSLNLCN